jgi:hypothetical protein
MARLLITDYPPPQRTNAFSREGGVLVVAAVEKPTPRQRLVTGVRPVGGAQLHGTVRGINCEREAAERS